MNSVDFYYNIDDEDKITKQIIYANTTFNVDQLISNSKKDSDLLSVTIITPTQKVSVPFYRSHVNGGHAGMTDIILSRIYPYYTRSKSADDQLIYSRNNENNIFVLTLDFTISIMLPNENKINQKQYDKLKQYMSEIKNSKYAAKWGNLLSIFLNDDDPFYIDELDEKIEALKDGVVEISIPKQNSIGQFDFSVCKSKDEIKGQDRIDTKTNNPQKVKKDFFKTRILNTALENEAREQVNLDMQAISNENSNDKKLL